MGLGVDHPFPTALGREIGLEGTGLLELGEIAEAFELASAMRLDKAVEEQATEQAREHPHRQEEARPTDDPAAAIKGDAASRHDAVDVGVV
jgi:hypothetical protein